MKTLPTHSKPFLVCCLCATSILWLLAPAVAQDGASESEAGADEAAMMEAYMAAGKPGEAHARLAETVGTWKMEIKSWMDPGAEPMVSEGTAEREMSLDGRVLVETVSSSMMGEPFTGHGMTGYDNVTGKYWSTWNDSMSTGISISHGTYDAETETYSFTGTYSNPMTGGTAKNRVEIHLQDGQEVMEYFEYYEGQEVKTMEIVYSRQ